MSSENSKEVEPTQTPVPNSNQAPFAANQNIQNSNHIILTPAEQELSKPELAAVSAEPTKANKLPNFHKFIAEVKSNPISKHLHLKPVEELIEIK